MPRILVVANPREAQQLLRWLSAAALGEVRLGVGSEETIEALEEEPVDLVVLTAGLQDYDALVFAHGLRARSWGASTSMILIGEERGPVRTALDAIEFRADHFLRRPLVKSALLYAVKSSLDLGPGVTASTPSAAAADLGGLAQMTATPPPNGGTALALGAALAEVTAGPKPTRAADVSSEVAVHALVTRLEEATSEAIDAFLHDLVQDALASPDSYLADLADDEAEEPEEIQEVEPDQIIQDDEPTPIPGDVPAWREATQILQDVAPPAAARPNAPEEARTGTFVSQLKKHMSDVEARLFGADGSGEHVAHDERPAPDIDLDAIGVATIPGLPHVDREPTPLPPSETTSDEGGFGAPGEAADGTGAGRRRTPRPAAPAIRGDLRDEEPAYLIARLHRESFSGRVSFKRGEAHKSLYFEDGRPVFATSNLPHDRMGDLLYREGKITREQHARSREIVAETGRRMGEILVDMGFLKRRELLPAVRRHVEDVAYSLFAWDSGTTTIVPGDTAKDEKIRLAAHPAALVMEGIRRKMSLERLRGRVGPPQGIVTPIKRDEMAPALVDAELTPEEKSVVELFDGRRSIADSLAAPEASGLDEAAVYHLIYGLTALGLVRVVDHRGRDTSPGAISAPAAQITGAADIAIDRERVLAKHAHVREADYFTVLGVRRDATSFEIKRAYEAARRDYAPESFPQEVQRDLSAELTEIAVVLDEAQRVLRNDRVRAQYLANLKD